MTLVANLACNRDQWAQQCLQTLLPDAPSKVVSDVGAGRGWMRDATERLGGAWQGFDQIVKTPGVRIWNLDDPAPADVPRPGIVLLLEVLEHLWNPEAALRHITEHLLPGGYLVLTSPNPSWSRSRLHALNHGVPYSFTRRHLPEHHVFTTWPHIVEHLLETLDLHVMTSVTLSPELGSSEAKGALDYVKARLIVALSRLIERSDPWAGGANFGLVARKPVAIERPR